MLGSDDIIAAAALTEMAGQAWRTTKPEPKPKEIV